MWTIVIFIDEDTVEVVPISWLLENQNSCYWPHKAISINTKIINCEPPDTIKWSIFRVRFPKNQMRTYGDYIKARELANRVVENSEISSCTDIEMSKRKSKKKIISSSESEMEESEENCLPFPVYGKDKQSLGASKKKHYERTESEQGITINDTENYNYSSEDLDTTVKNIKASDQHIKKYNYETQKSDTCRYKRDQKTHNYVGKKNSLRKKADTHIEDDCDDLPEEPTTNNLNSVLIRQLIRQIAIMNTKLENIQQDVTTLLLQKKGEEEKNKNIDEVTKYLPLKSKSDIQVFEEFLTNSLENFQQFTDYISHIGGYHISDITQRALARVLTNNMGSTFSWVGRKGKDSFQELQISRGILDGLTKNHIIKTKHTEKELEVAISNWLRHAPERLKREKN